MSNRSKTLQVVNNDHAPVDRDVTQFRLAEAVQRLAAIFTGMRDDVAVRFGDMPVRDQRNLIWMMQDLIDQADAAGAAYFGNDWNIVEVARGEGEAHV